MSDQELQKALDEMRSYIQRDVAAGFRAEEDICNSVVEVMADSYDADELRPHAERLTREQIQAHLLDILATPDRLRPP